MYFMRLAMPFQRQLETCIYQKQETSGLIWPAHKVDGTTWTSERMKRAIQRESEIGMGVRLNISAYRQIAIAMARKYLGPQVGFEADGETEQEEEEDEDGCWWTAEDDVLDLQAGHGTHVAGMIYARGVDEAPGTVAHMKQQFRQASERWHRFLGFPSATRAGQKRKRRQETMDTATRQKQFAQWQAMQTAAIQPILEQIVGPGSQFWGIQQPAIKAIMGGAPWVLGVMGTGGGKSIIFMVPAAWERTGTTIVVVPTVSLRQDMQRRCAVARISCAVWNSHRPPGTASIVLVTPESAVSKGFRSFINRLEDRNRLDRIVIDECHTILDSRNDFRPKVQALHRLMTIGCPVVMLTATLPPLDQTRLLQRLKIPTDMVQVFRSPHTTRTNIQYQVTHLDGSEETAVAFIRQREAQWHPTGGKIIVYCVTTEQVEALAERLRCRAYHGQMPEARKQQMLDQFIQTMSGATITATNALGMGSTSPRSRRSSTWTCRRCCGIMRRKVGGPDEMGRPARRSSLHRRDIARGDGTNGRTAPWKGSTPCGHFSRASSAVGPCWMDIWMDSRGGRDVMGPGAKPYVIFAHGTRPRRHRRPSSPRSRHNRYGRANSSIQEHDNVIFTDGSARKGLIGSAVAWRQLQQLELWIPVIATKKTLGQSWMVIWETTARQDDSNEYAAELQAICQALQLLTRQPTRSCPTEVTICTDCQAAIQSIKNPQQQSGQYLIRSILQLGLQLQRQGVKIDLYWVPAHVGITGNEIAHTYAHMATSDPGYQPAPGWEQLRLKSAALKAGREKILKKKEVMFQQAEYGKRLYKLDQALPGDHMVKAYNSMSYEDARILVQLRTGHNGLNSYLHMIKKVESAQCECGLGEETVAHFLFLCPRWTESRQPLRQAMGNRWSDLSYDLGGWTNRRDTSTAQLVNGQREKWKPDPSILKAVVRFVKATARFQPIAQLGEQKDNF